MNDNFIDIFVKALSTLNTEEKKYVLKLIQERLNERGIQK